MKIRYITQPKAPPFFVLFGYSVSGVPESNKRCLDAPGRRQPVCGEKEAQFVRFCRRSRAGAVLRDVKSP